MKINGIVTVMLLCCSSLGAKDLEGEMHLLLGKEDKGSIVLEQQTDKIVSFVCNDDGWYEFNKVDQDFGADVEYSMRINGSDSVVVYYNKLMHFKVVNVKIPDKFTIYKPVSYTSFSSAYEYKDELVIFVGPVEGKEEGSVYLYDTISGTSKVEDHKVWLKTLGPGTFKIADESVRYALKWMNDEVFLPAPKSPIRTDNIKTLAMISRGERFVYFRGDEVPGLAGNRLLIYDEDLKKWHEDSVKGTASDMVSFEDNFAIKHKYWSGEPYSSTSVFDGVWTVYINGKKQEISLGAGSEILYLSDNRLIFSDDSRLYSCPIENHTVKGSLVKKIADDDRIRFATSIFW